MATFLAASLLVALAAADTPGGCATAAADAEVIAPRFAPELFLGGGFMDLGEGTGASRLGAPAWRLSAGLELRLAKLRRARAVRAHALAECRRDGIEARLRAVVNAGEPVARAAALRARAEVLERQLPQAEGIAAEVAGAVKEARATLDELDGVRLRLDHLRSFAAETAAARAMQDEVAVRGESLPALLAAWRAADDARARTGFAVHRAGAIDLRLRGGYDQVLDGRSDVPLFGMATFTFDLGALSSRRAEARAHEARRLARDADEDLGGRAEALLARLRSLRDTERGRLAQVTALRADLATQLRAVEAIASGEVRRYRNTLWFELARLDAERAYLEVHAAALDRVLGP